MSFTFVDLFSGIGGFHAAVSGLGGRAVLAAEIDPAPAGIYARNWGLDPAHDVVELARAPLARVPAHDVLVGGFPCQPFSKSGAQRGMSELRGQMFSEVLKILDAHRPPLVVLENVRNLVGPRQRPVWEAIVAGLRYAGYKTTDEPVLFSPHLLPKNRGGSPQTRERIYVLAVYVGRERALAETDGDPMDLRHEFADWTPRDWDLVRDVVVDGSETDPATSLGAEERRWIEAWDDFLRRTAAVRLPGFPLWSMYWRDDAFVDPAAPTWKQAFEAKNIQFYRDNRSTIRAWQRANPDVESFPVSRRKLEWQAGDSDREMAKCLLHLRPSGIRVKKPNYTPALVAMAQVPILGSQTRKLSVREAARLQGFPDWFDFGDQRAALSHKQLGNAVHVGAMYHVIRSFVLAQASELCASEAGRRIFDSVVGKAERCVIAQPESDSLVIDELLTGSPALVG